MSESYLKTLDTLLSLPSFSKTKYQLKDCLTLYQALNNPQQTYPTIHIGGSNGKGSLITQIASCLEKSGYRVGKYTQPHISCFRERIQVNSSYISEDEIVKSFHQVMEKAQTLGIHPTFFEVATAMAFSYFAKEEVDIAVIEVGIGGRLDATNALQPCLTAVTSICLEHTDILGDNLEDIAKEKLGIAKPGIPLIIGPTVPSHLIPQNVPFTQTIDDATPTLTREVAKALRQQFSITETALKEALCTYPPCRKQEIGKGAVLLDVAHNPASLKRLFDQLPSDPFRLVMSLTKAEHLIQCLQLIPPHVTAIHFTQGTNARCLSPQLLADTMRPLHPSPISWNNDPFEEIGKAVHAGFAKGETIVVCGSFFIMQAACKLLSINGICDPIDTNEKIFYNRYMKGTVR